MVTAKKVAPAKPPASLPEAIRALAKANKEIRRLEGELDRLTKENARLRVNLETDLPLTWS